MSDLKFAMRGAAPTTPAAGEMKLYFDADGTPHVMDDTGTATDLFGYLGALGMATQAPDAVAITGGSLAGVAIAGPSINGGSMTAAGAVTTTDGGIGYATGAGGTVTQTGSKSTSVTLNKLTGNITMASSALNAETTVSFTLNSSMIAAQDQIDVTHHSGGTQGAYTCGGYATGPGTATIWLRNSQSADQVAPIDATIGRLTESPVLKFFVKKAVAS